MFIIERKKDQNNAEDYFQHSGYKNNFSLSGATYSYNFRMENYWSAARNKKICYDCRTSYYELGFFLRTFTDFVF